MNVTADGAALLNATRLERRRLDRRGAVQRDRQGARPHGRAEQGLEPGATRAIEDSDVTRRRRPDGARLRRGRDLVEHQDRLLLADDERRRRGRPAGRDQQLHRRRQVPLQRRAAGPRARRHRPHPRRPGHARRQEGRRLRVDGRGRPGRPDDHGLHRPRPLAAGRREHRVPAGLNVTNSDSMASAPRSCSTTSGATSRPRSGTTRRSPPAASTVEALESATIVATTDVSGSSSGGSSLTGQGQSLAAGGMIATNRVQSGARAIVDETSLETTVGDVTVAASNDSLIEATNLVAMQSGSQSVAICSRSTPSAGAARTCSSPRSTRCSATR